MTGGRLRKVTLNLILLVFFGFLASIVQAQPNLNFDDIPEDHWASDSVERLKSVGMLQGFPDGGYYGNTVLSRYQMAVLLDRMLILARQEAQTEGLSIGEITTLQQQIDQLNSILSQSVQTLIAPSLQNSATQNLQVPSQNQQQVTSRSALITPAPPQDKYYEVQQAQANTNNSAVNSNSVQSSVQTNVASAPVRNNNFENGNVAVSTASQQGAEQIIASYQASPSAIEYQDYLDAYVAVYGSSEDDADDAQSVNKIGVVPNQAGSVSPILSRITNEQQQAQQQVQNQTQQQVQQAQQIQTQQNVAQSSEPSGEQYDYQYAQQFAEQYQLYAKQPTASEAQSFQRQSQQQPLAFATDNSFNTQTIAQVEQPITPQLSNTAQTAQVETLQNDASNDAPEDTIVQSNGIYLQLGAFANALSAERLATELGGFGFSPIQQEVSGLFKIFVGPYDFVTLQPATETLTEQGYNFFMVR